MKSDTSSKDHIIKRAVELNDPQYNVDKAIEEMAELTNELATRRTKPAGYDGRKISKEIGDVMLRLTMLTRAEGRSAAVKERINYKVEKMSKNLETGKYRNV